MNITNTLTRGITAQLVAGITLLSLLLSALPAAFFVAEAASDLYTDASATVETTSPYASGAINAAGFSNLTLIFSYDSRKLDGDDDSFSYGWRTVGGSNNPLGTVDGLAGNTANEMKTITPVSLPAGAQVSNLEIYIEVTAVPGGNGDQVSITDLKVSGDPVSVACTPQFNVASPTNIRNTNSGDYFNTVNDALADCDTDNGDTVELLGDISIGNQITINRPITLDGNGFTISPTFARTGPNNNASIGIIDTNDVTVKDLEIDGTGGTDLHGINIYRSTAVTINDTTINNPKRTGVVVNGSNVIVNNLTTSGSQWHAINAAPGIGVTEATVLTVKGVSVHSEGSPTPHIFTDDTSKNVTVNDTNSQYEIVYEGVNLQNPSINARSWRLKSAVPPVVPPPPADATIIATKIVCDYEALLPNDGYSSIGASTAVDFLASTPERTADCRLLPDWKFQYVVGQNNTNSNDGELPAPWITSPVTNGVGKTTITIPGTVLSGNPTISVREVLKENFITFKDTGVSAELYCDNDAAGYDNLEWISGVASGSTHYCVAWNVSKDKVKPVTTISEPVNGLSTTTDFKITIRSTDETQLAMMVVNLKKPDGSQMLSCLLAEVSGKDQTRTCIVDVDALAPGTYSFKANAHDTGGNVSNTIIQTFTVGSAPAPKCLNLLTNGSFEAEANTVTDPNLWQKFASVAGWAITKVTGSEPTTLELHNGWSGNQAADGAQYAELDGDHSTKITQTVTTIPGATYELKWAFAGRHDIDANQNKLSVLIDGSQVATEGPVNGLSNLLPASWKRSSVVFTADGSTDITFADSGESDSYGTFLDDAELCLVRKPEPVATIIAEKVVCKTENALPNWNNRPGGAPKITQSTATDFVAQSNGLCSLVPDWEFQWALPGVADPSDTLVGPAGGGWTTFGKTKANGKTSVALTSNQLKGKPFIWVREVLKDGYLGFSHGATPDNSNDKTAEMYCHTDRLNYDNFDRVDGIRVGNTYHCVAFNYELPKPVEQCELTMFSDEGTVVVERNGYALETYDGNTNWKADIPGATWIWDSFKANEIDNNESETFTFKESFVVNNPSFADLDIASDNDYEISVNGIVRVPFSGESHFGLLSKDDINLLPYLANGNNLISIKVKNFGLTNSSYLENPAGLLYKLVVKGDKSESCKVTTAIDEKPEPETYRIHGFKFEGNVEVSTPKADWVINLLDDEGEIVKSTTTDEEGYYYFDVLAGDYEVHEYMPVNWEQNAVTSDTPKAVETDGRTGIQNCWFVFPGRPVKLPETANSEEERPLIVEEYEANCDFYNTPTNDENDPPPIPEVDDEDDNNNSGVATRIGIANTPAPLVLGVATLQCGMYLFDYMRQGISNESWEVTKLQWFLVGQGYNIAVTGVFDEATDTAAREFQMKYQSEVLTPWYTAGIVPHQNPTGWVYQLTRWKINNIVCPGSEAPPTLLP